MKKITFLLIFTSFYVFPQKTDLKIRHNTAYTNIKHYKSRFGANFTKNDSLYFIIKDNDTLVPLPKDYKRPKGVSVPYEQKTDEFLELYKDIVYKKYHTPRKESFKKLRMRHWNKPLRIYFTKSVDKTVKKELKQFAQYLSREVDSLRIVFVNNLEKSNYLIYGFNSTLDYKYDNRIKSKNNDFYISWRRNRLYDCKLQINSNSFKNKQDLVLESKKLFLKTLGYFNFTKLLPKDNYYSSYYSNTKQFTEKDLEILKYHYSYGICKGTDLDTFEENHLEAKEVLKKTGRNLIFFHPNEPILKKL